MLFILMSINNFSTLRSRTDAERAALGCLGTHVRSVDDDHEFPPGHTAACYAAVRADPEAIWTIGEIVPALIGGCDASSNQAI